ncbi:MAG: hypothetical protein ABII90_02640 [Bacteroidota bacterium]
MDLQAIEHLLEKYYNGETSLEEEQQLRDYFNTHEVPDHLKHEQAQFKYYKTAIQEKITNAEFEGNVLQAIKQSPAKGKIRQIKHYIYYPAAIAASVALLVGIYFRVYDSSTINSPIAEMKNTYDDPERAYFETKKALLMVSEKFNKGIKNVNKISKFHQAQELITNKNK